MAKRKPADFLAAFRVVFVYQVRKKFGLADDLSTVEKYVRPLLIPVYIVLLYFFTQKNHYDIPLVLTYYLWMECHLKRKRSMLHDERAK